MDPNIFFSKKRINLEPSIALLATLSSLVNIKVSPYSNKESNLFSSGLSIFVGSIIAVEIYSPTDIIEPLFPRIFLFSGLLQQPLVLYK